MYRIHAGRLTGFAAAALWACVAAAADPWSPPQLPALDPPAVTRDADVPARRVPFAAPGAGAAYSHGDPTAQEQYMLEIVNRARANPTAEGLRLKSTTDPDILAAYAFFHVDTAGMAAEFAGYPVRPPLAFNANLIASARAHSQDMARNDFQGHTGTDGSSLVTRVASAGYTGWNALAENVYAYAESVFYGHAGFNVDWGQPDLGHRMNIMNFSPAGTVYTEVGIGIVPESSPNTGVGPLVVTEDFGRRSGQLFVVGVVYSDVDHDGFYGVGEGLGGVTITTSQGNSAYTSASGGYAVPLAASGGGVTVRAEGGVLGPAQERTVVLAGTNVKVDFFAGTRSSQTIVFGAVPGAIVVGGTATVGATATSGLPVTFGSSTPSACTVSGSTVTGVNAGTCTIRASQPGDALWNPAPDVERSFAVVGAAAAAADMNQHGLTGSWYEPATSGQGLEVEVFPDQTAPGSGLVFASWFTFDGVAGASERQRWYTLSGPVVAGQPSAALTIHQNVGGNFNALPVTTATPVGTATLSFDSCSSGLLAYSFGDGTGRTGTIPLTRLTPNVTCSTSSARPVNPDFALSGNWYDPATSGQGLTIEVNPNSSTVFAAWYAYAPSGVGAGASGQRWYTAQPTTFAPGARSIPVTLYQTTGGQFDTPTAPGQRTVAVGSGTIAFQSCSAATFSYSFTGGSSSGSSGTIALKRVGPVPKGCTPEPAQPACAQIGGMWNVTDDMTFTCTGSFGSGTTTQSGTANLTITQTGCNISFPSPIGTADTIRTGSVSGNTFQAYGPLSAASAGYLLSQNRIEFSGAVVNDGRRIDTTGVGMVSGTYQGSPGTCTASSKETWTR